MSHDLIFLENRRTPKVVKKGEKYTPKPSEGKISRRRAATAEEEKTIARGDWVRVNEKGQKPSDSGYKDKKSKIRPKLSSFLETVTREYNVMRARAQFGDGYEGVTVAGVAIVAADTGRVFLAQRSMDETDDPEVQQTWEFPGGHLNPDEDPYIAAMREFTEEIGVDFPADAHVMGGWRSEDGHYQGFVVNVGTEWDTEAWSTTDEVQATGWFDIDDITDMTAAGTLRPEVANTDWDMVFDAVSGNEESDMPEDALAAAAQVGVADEYEQVDAPDGEAEAVEPDLTSLDLALDGIPVHGVVAPEDVETGDGRGFNPGSMTSRPGRLPFSWQVESNPGHDKSIVVGSMDRMMRKDGLIHWEGMLMPSPSADEFTGLLAFFSRFGVSVDGDRGSLDSERSGESGVRWFDAVRASGLTAVAIPAFSEAYVALGPHPEMPSRDGSDALAASMAESGDLVTFDRGPGWVTHPKETNRIHDYWTKPGEPGYAKIRWGTPGDFTRAKKLIGEKIGKNSPEDMRYLNQIIAQWHFDALGYWPGELGKPGNAPDTPENRRRAARHAAAARGISLSEDEDSWETVLVSSAGAPVRPPMDYFTYQGEEAHGALTIADPDEFGIRHTYGYAAEWGVCHIGYDGRCVEAPMDAADFAEFHLGYTRLADGERINTGVITYKVEHRDAQTILTETAQQSHFDNVAHAWASVRLGMDDRGIWFSGVVLPGISDDDLTLIEATGQVSGEWKYGALRALQAVNVPGFPVMRSSAAYDDDGNVVALVASAHGLSGCEPTPAERIAALRAAHTEAEVESRFATLRAQWATREEK